MKSILTLIFAITLTVQTGCQSSQASKAQGITEENEQTQAPDPAAPASDTLPSHTNAPAPPAIPEQTTVSPTPRGPSHSMNHFLQPLTGPGLDSKDMNYSLVFDINRETQKPRLNFVFRRSLGSCNDQKTPEAVIFDHWGIYPTKELTFLPDSGPEENIIKIKKNEDEYYIVGTRNGLCLPNESQPQCELKADWVGDCLTLKIYDLGSSSPKPIWEQSFKMPQTLKPLPMIRPARDREFCINGDHK